MTAGSARAFVPGHVTAFFAPHSHENPLRAGSTGAGFTLDDGVDVTVTPAPDTAIQVNGTTLNMDPVERVLSVLDATVTVEAQTPLNIGTGFGVSGAMALGTALAVNAATDGDRSENELIRIAHRAEVEAGTGLGDVVAQARGGIPIRLAPGAPGYGELDGIPHPTRLEYVSFGNLSTPAVLSGDTSPIRTGGQAALAELRETPRLEKLFELARIFAKETDLLTDRIERVIDDVRAEGGEAMMAMLGETVVALDTGLSDAGYDPSVCHTHPGGATVSP